MSPAAPAAPDPIEQIIDEFGFDDSPAPATPASPDEGEGEASPSFVPPPAASAQFARDDVFDRGDQAGTVADPDWDKPVRARRNPAKLWTMAAVVFFLAVVGAGGALFYFGPPAWAVRAGLLSDASEPELLLYLAKPVERRKLPSGQEYFAFSARVVNSGTHKAPVPPVMVELRDGQNRLVLSWATRADKNELKPGEEASINESRRDIPRNAKNLSLSFLDRTM